MSDLTTGAVMCPNCNAQPNQPCTVPDGYNSRRPVPWFHMAREEAAYRASIRPR